MNEAPTETPAAPAAFAALAAYAAPAAPLAVATPAVPAALSSGTMPTLASTLAAAPVPAAPARPTAELTRVYRGRTVEELIPKIEAELGGDAIVVRREKGLTGGFAGFFQRPFVEIEAKAGTPRVDRYDEAGGAPALPDALTGNAAAALPHPPASRAPALPDALTGNAAAALPHPPASGAPALPDALAGNAAAALPHPPASGAPALPDALAGPPASAPQARPPAGEAAATPADQIAAEFEELTPASFIAAAGTPAHDPFTAALAHAESALPAPVVTRTAVPARPAVEQQAPAQPQAPAHLQEPAQPQALAQQLAPIQPQTAAQTAAQTPAEAQPPQTVAPAGAAPTLATPATQATSQEPPPVQHQAAPAPAAPATQAAPTPPRGRARAKIEEQLLGCGIGEALMRELIETAAAHTLALMGARTSLAGAVQRTLAQRIPAAKPLPVGGAAVALVGPGGSGKTSCAQAFLAAYGARSTVGATHATLAAGEEPAKELGQAREQGLLVLDLPAVSPADRGAIRAQAVQLQSVKPDRVVLALPATLGARAAAQLLEALRPLGVDALALTHTDETDQLGVAVEAACLYGLAPAYLLSGGGGGGRGDLTQIDPAELAQRLLS